MIDRWHDRLGQVLWGLAALASLAGWCLPAAQAQAAPALTANFHTVGIYWSREANAAGIEIRYRKSGATQWLGAQDLWWDGISPLQSFRKQYRGSIVNLSPATTYDVSYSLNGGGTWSSPLTISTRAESFPGKTTQYSGVRNTKLVISASGTAQNWRIFDGQNQAIIDPGHNDDCVRISASYVVLRNFVLRDCRANGIVIEKPNVVIEHNTISDWGIQEISAQNTTPRIGNASKKPLSDPSSTCIAGVAKSDFGRVLDTGILVKPSGNDGIVIQRNVIRDPRYRSTRWVECPGFDKHPWGPRAINIGASGSNLGRGNVIRYNEIYATNTTAGVVQLKDNANRYYDILGVSYQQDLDIYGNIIRNGTDDAIEADDAAVNVRIWGNYIDFSLTMISLQLMQAGPAYIFRNIFDRAADNNTGNPGTFNVGVDTPLYTSDSSIKIKQNNGGSLSAWLGPAFIYHNTVLRSGFDGFSFGYDIRIESASKEPNNFFNLISSNNIFMTATNYLYDTHPKNWVDYLFSDMFNRPLNVNASYNLEDNLQATAVWKDGHGPSGTWAPAPTVPTGLYQATNAGDGRPLPNFNDSASRGRGAHQYRPGADDPMTFGILANWTYRPSE